jgi:hypothetical protein
MCKTLRASFRPSSVRNTCFSRADVGCIRVTTARRLLRLGGRKLARYDNMMVSPPSRSSLSRGTEAAWTAS